MSNPPPEEEVSFKQQMDTRDRYVYYVPETSFRDKTVRLGAMMGMVETSRYQKDRWSHVESTIHMAMFVAIEYDDDELKKLVKELEVGYYGTKFVKKWQDPSNFNFQAPKHEPVRLPIANRKNDQLPPLYFLWSDAELSYRDEDFVDIRGYVNENNELVRKPPKIYWHSMVQESYNKLIPIVAQISVIISDYLNIREELKDLHIIVSQTVDNVLRALETEKNLATEHAQSMMEEEEKLAWGDEAMYFALVKVTSRALPEKFHKKIVRWSYEPKKVRGVGDLGTFASFGGAKIDQSKTDDDHSFAKLTQDKMYNLQIMASIAHDSSLNMDSPVNTFRKFGEVMQYIGQGIVQIQKSSSEESKGGATFERYEWWDTDISIVYNKMLKHYISLKYAMENNFLTSATNDEMSLYLNMTNMIEEVFTIANRWMLNAVEFILQRKAVDKTKQTKFGGDKDWSEQ